MFGKDPRHTDYRPVNGGQQVDAVWRNAELHDPAGRGEVAHCKPEASEAEVRQRAQQPLSVLTFRAFKHANSSPG